MLRYLFSNKNVDRLLVFLVILLSSRASTIANSELTIFAVLMINVVVMVIRGIKIDKPFIVIVIPVFLLLILQNYLQADGQINLLRYLKLFSIIAVAYCTIKTVQFDFFRHYNKLIYGAILLSLPFYVWQVCSTDSLHDFGIMISHMFPSMVETQPSSQNILVYTIEFVDKTRNSGPMWEPGGFATMIALAIYFELLRNRFSISKRVLVYLLGVLITFSTTGYLLCLVLTFLYLQNYIKGKSAKLRLYLYMVVVPVFIAVAATVFFTSDLMYNKIQFLFEDQMSKVEDIQRVEDMNLDTKFSLGRFGSLVIDLQSVSDNPLFGRGYDDDAFRLGSYESFNLTNGLSNYTARLGLIGLLWLILSVARSGKMIELALSGTNSNNNILILMVLVIAFSNPVLFTPLYIMLSFLFIPFKLKPTNTL